MAQLQKEWWSRFTIPLVRLDSRGNQRIRQRIPANQNPFYYYNKAIISIDTLKRGAEYRTFIEDANWDIVVVGEAQNAKRDSTESQRHRLADQLSRRCDTMIMLSATPHDGSPESFASLMNMLDPTAIANPSDYSREDIDGLFVRRFKIDVSAIDRKYQEKDSRGTRPYAPKMMVGLLLYGCSVGIRSSPKLEKATYEDIPFRVLTAGNHPDHTRISEFRRKHLDELEDLFLQVFQICQRMGLVELGNAALDGTKVQVNPSNVEGRKRSASERPVLSGDDRPAV